MHDIRRILAWYNLYMDFKKLSKVVVFFIIFVFSALILLACAFLYKQDKNAYQYYSQGLEFYENKDYQNAYYNFSKIYPASKLFYNSLYKQAKCADLIDDKKTAIKKYETLNKLVKNKYISPFVLWRLGNLYEETNKKYKAKKTYLKLNEKYKDSEYSIASNYKLAQFENNKEKKAHLLSLYLKNSPSGKYSINALSDIKNYKDFLSEEEKISCALSYYENKMYMESVLFLKGVPIEHTWVYLIKALDKLNSTSNVIKVAKKGFGTENSIFDDDTLDEIISIYLNHIKGNTLLELENIYNTSKEDKIKAIVLYKSTFYTDKDEAYKRKVRLYEAYPNSKYAQIALYQLFRWALTENKIILASKYGKLHLARYNDKNTTPAVLYFMALIQKKTMDAKWKDALSRLESEYRNSYYTYRAYSNIENKNFENKRNIQVAKNIKIDFPYSDDKVAKTFFENFLFEDDTQNIEDFRINDPVLKSWIEYKKGNRALSSVIARDYIQSSKVLPARDNVVWKLAYPIYYSEPINKWASDKGLNPYLILSVIKEESHFNPNIQSPVGAIGLSQIMPSTALMISDKSYSVSELRDPDINIELGSKYFSYLMDIFSDNESLCVLSYNSGPNAVKGWLKEFQDLPFDIMVENIPYRETREYIKKVYGAYWNYLLTYENVKI